MLLIVCCILLGTLLSGIWFGLNVIINVFASKVKVAWLARYSALFSAFLPTCIILKNSSLCLWNIESVDGRGVYSWLAIHFVFIDRRKAMNCR